STPIPGAAGVGGIAVVDAAFAGAGSVGAKGAASGAAGATTSGSRAIDADAGVAAVSTAAVSAAATSLFFLGAGAISGAVSLIASSHSTVLRPKAAVGSFRRFEHGRCAGTELLEQGRLI